MGKLYTFDLIESQFDDFVVGLIGQPKVGKTTVLLDLLEKGLGTKEGEFVYIISTDRGLRGMARRDPRIKKRMMLSTDTSYAGVKDAIDEIRERVEAQIAKGAPASHRWVVLDHVTDLANKFLAESRRVSLKGSGTVRSKNQVREQATQTDYGMLLTWMTEIMAKLIEIPANKVIIGLEEQDYATKLPTLQMSGKSQGHVLGCCDVIARLILADKDVGGRVFDFHAIGGDGSAAYRDGANKLPDTMPADLARLRDLYLGR